MDDELTPPPSLPFVGQLWVLKLISDYGRAYEDRIFELTRITEPDPEDELPEWIYWFKDVRRHTTTALLSFTRIPTANEAFHPYSC